MQGGIESEAVPTGTAVPPKLGLEGEAYWSTEASTSTDSVLMSRIFTDLRGLKILIATTSTFKGFI